MQVVVLGCGGSAGVPMIGGPDGKGDWGACDRCETRNSRTRSSIVLEGPGGGRILVDTGPDLRSQILACAVPVIDAIVYTHAHADHVSGIDEVRGLNRLINRPIQAYAFPETLTELQLRYAFAFLPWSPPGFYRPVLAPEPVTPTSELDICGLNLKLFEQTHGRTRTLGFRAGQFAYSTDMVGLGPGALAIWLE